MSKPILIRTRDIADISGQTPAIVSNWRKRAKGFPQPVEGADTNSPLYELDKVREWLEERGTLKLDAYVDVLGRIIAMSLVDDLVDTGFSRPEAVNWASALVTLVEVAGEASPQAMSRVIGDRPRLTSAFRTLLSADTSVWEKLAHPLAAVSLFVSNDSGLREGVHEAILAVPSATRVGRLEHLTAPALAELMVKLLKPEEGIVFDPAAGYGYCLTAALESAPGLKAVGVEIDPVAAEISHRRAIFARLHLDVTVGDSLSDDPVAGLHAQTVVLEPPFGQGTAPDFSPNDPRWSFGNPRFSETGMWLQHAIFHLAEGGRACVLTPEADLARSATEKIRRGMLQKGAVEAIVTLPPRIIPQTSKPFSLWILARPGQTVDPDRVLLIDLSDPSRRGEPDTSDAVRIYRRWREDRVLDPSPLAVLVPVRELMEEGRSLVPSQWLQARELRDSGAIVTHLRELYEVAARWQGREGVLKQPILEAHTRDTRRDPLRSLEGVEILRGNGSAERPENPADGFPLLAETEPRVRGQVYWDLEVWLSEPDLSFPAGTSGDEQPILTKSGDVLVCSDYDGTFTAVFPHAGWLVSKRYQIVRVDPSQWDPWFVEACINAAAERLGPKPATSLIVSRIEIPVLPIDEQRRIGRAVRELGDHIRGLRGQLERYTEIQQYLVAGIGLNSISFLEEDQ